MEELRKAARDHENRGGDLFSFYDGAQWQREHIDVKLANQILSDKVLKAIISASNEYLTSTSQVGCSLSGQLEYVRRKLARLY